MVIAIRESNESSLTGDFENTWGFGQIVALVLFMPTFTECVVGFAGMSEQRRTRYGERWKSNPL